MPRGLDSVRSGKAGAGEERLPSLDEREASAMHGESSYELRSPSPPSRPGSRQGQRYDFRRPASRQGPPQGGGGCGARSPSPAFLTDFAYEMGGPGGPPSRAGSPAFGPQHYGTAPQERPSSRMSLYYPDRPTSRQSTVSIDSFRSMPVAPLGGSRPLWATVSERKVTTARRRTAAASKYGHLPTGVSRPAAFSAAMPPGGKVPDSVKNAKRPQMPRLVDVAPNNDGTRDVGMQAAPCMWTRFFFETPQDKDLGSRMDTSTFQHFDVTFQPDPLGPIDMSSPLKDGKARGGNTNKNLREWVQKSHESVYLITQVLPPDTFVDIDNVRELQESGERDAVWPLPASEGGGYAIGDQAELVSLVEYTRTVCRMEPRSSDDSRQLIKLQRGVLTAVVTVMNEIEKRYEDRYLERAAQVEAEFQAKVASIQAENNELKVKMADYMELKERLAYLDRIEMELADVKGKLHSTEDALRDALAKLAAVGDLESRNAELAARLDDLLKQLEAMTRVKDKEHSDKMSFKFEVATLRKVVEASKNAGELERLRDELERLQKDNNELTVVNGEQEVEIEELKRKLTAAELRQAELEARLAAQKAQQAGEAAEAARLAAALKSAEEAARIAKLTARMMGAHTATLGRGELIPYRMPEWSRATLPAGFQEFGSPVTVFLHKRMRVSLPASMARADGSLEAEGAAPLLRPGEEALVGAMPAVEPAEAMARRALTLLDGLPEEDYAWVNVPMGAVIEAEGVDEGRSLLLPGTTVTTQGQRAQLVEVPAACSVALPFNDAGDTQRLRLPAATVVNCGDSCERQLAPTGPPDRMGVISYDAPGGCAFTIGPLKDDKPSWAVTAPPGTTVTLAVDGKPVPSRWASMDVTRKCLWCALRASGAGAEEGEGEGEEKPAIMRLQQRRPSTAAAASAKGGCIGFVEAEVDCLEDCGTLAVLVGRSGGTEGVAEVVVSTQDGTANEIVDYGPVQGVVLRWEDGDAAPKAVEVPIVDDDFTQEDDEEFHVVIESIHQGDVVIGSARCTVTIKDSDKPRQHREVPSTLDPTSLAWEQEGFREMALPKTWKKLLGKNKIDNSKMMTLEKCRKLIFQLYATKRSADLVDDRAGNNRALLDDYTAEFLKNYLGVVGLGKKLGEFLARLRYEYRRRNDAFVCQFVCLVGLYDPQPPVAHWVVVKGLDLASSHCTATGCNPSVFWTQMHKGKRISLRSEEAQSFLQQFMTIRDSSGKPYQSPEIEPGQVESFLDKVIREEAAKSDSASEDAISLDRLMAFLVSTMLWLNNRAGPRVAEVFKGYTRSSDGRLDYDAVRSGIMSIIAWNEASNVALYQRALTYEAEGADSVSVNTMVKATYDMHDVVCFASAS